MSNLKITAHELAVIIDTFNHSLKVSNWHGFYTHESRERVRDVITEIMNSMSVEVITDEANFILDADTGI